MVAVGVFISGALSIILGLFALPQVKRVAASRFFFLTTLGTALWSFGISIFISTKSQDVLVTVAAVYYIAAALIALAAILLGFTLYAKRSPSRIALLLVSLPFIALSIFLVIDPHILITNPTISTSNSVELIPSTYVIYMVYFSVYYLAGLSFMLAAYWKATASGRERLGYLFWAYLVAGSVGMWFNLLLPGFGNYQLIWAGPLGLLLFVPIVYIAIIRHGLFDIRLVLSRTVTYALLLAALTLIYVGIVTLISKLIIPAYADANGDYVAIFSTLVLVLLFQPIKRFFDSVTNSLFFRGRYSRDAFYSSLNEVLTDTTELISLLKRSSQVIASTLSADAVFFALADKQGTPMSIGTKDRVTFIQADYDYLVGVWSKREVQFEKDIAVRDTLSESDQDMALSRLFRSYGIQLAVPLRQSEAVIGFLFVADRRSGSYTVRDISVIETIADELAIAIENAMSLREVKLLNETLQQRIDEATKELRHSNAQLRKLDEAKDEFISMASHQLRTPLTSIKGYIDMMLDGDAGEVTPMQRQFLTEAFVSSERMVHLINDFLNVSRLQTGKFMLEKRPTDLSEVVKQEIESLTISASGRDLSFKLKLGKTIPKLLIDEAKIRQVIMNFADNALYYSKPGSAISIELKKEGDSVLFTVKDTGIGVPVEEQGHLFTKFYRAANARKQRPDGTGVGLYLAKRVVLAHGGSIVFDSVEGKGSTFGFRLPISALAPTDDTN